MPDLELSMPLQRRRAALYQDLFLPAMLFGSIGAIAWAIRGTSGWNGIDGTIVPGMMWGILWYYICQRKGVACSGAPLWLGLGLSLGGELGYGQYVSWIRGEFHAGADVLPIAPWHGWIWFVLSGISWTAVGSALLGWSLSRRSSWGVWLGRLTVPFAVAGLGWLLIQWQPALFFPKYGLGLYAGALDEHLERTVYTNTQNFVVVAWLIGAILVAAIQRDRTTLVMCTLVGIGFGPGFAISAVWCLGYTYAPQYIDWWKVWELHAGFNLGVLYALALYWTLRQAEQTKAGEIATPAPVAVALPVRAWCVRNVAETLAVFLFVVAIFVEDEPVTSIGMGLLYVAFMAALTVQAARGLNPQVRDARRGAISLVFCVFLFLFVTLHGSTSTLGIVLELYPPASVDQYSWPLRRILLFLPMALVVIGGTVRALLQILRPRGEEPHGRDASWLPNRITDLMTGLAAVGALSIWPEEIGILYAVFLGMAVWAINRFRTD